MAGSAGLVIIDGQAFFKKELLTECDTFRGIVFCTRHDIGQGFKKTIRTLDQQVDIAGESTACRRQ